jgi:8-oxo-dGTP diphosphatase
MPGGFVDYGESVAVREAREETCLEVNLTEQFYTYSDPRRDPRHHTLAVVFIATAQGTPRGADDARVAKIFFENNLPAPLAFDHAVILRDYFHFKKAGQRPKPTRLIRRLLFNSVNTPSGKSHWGKSSV